jgi:hypothetical protein
MLVYLSTRPAPLTQAAREQNLLQVIMENAMKKILVLLVILFLLCILAGCRESTPSGAMLSQKERESVLAYSEPKMDSLLEGWNAADYALFSKDFNQDALESMTQEEFEKLRNDEFTGLGSYHSREVEGVVLRSDGSYTVIYYVVFDNDDEVLVRVTFRADKPHEISGLRFEK